jgi:hypothetical protein
LCQRGINFADALPVAAARAPLNRRTNTLYGHGPLLRSPLARTVGCASRTLGWSRVRLLCCAVARNITSPCAHTHTHTAAACIIAVVLLQLIIIVYDNDRKAVSLYLLFMAGAKSAAPAALLIASHFSCPISR